MKKVIDCHLILLPRWSITFFDGQSLHPICNDWWFVANRLQRIHKQGHPIHTKHRSLIRPPMNLSSEIKRISRKRLLFNKIYPPADWRHCFLFWILWNANRDIWLFWFDGIPMKMEVNSCFHRRISISLKNAIFPSTPDWFWIAPTKSDLPGKTYIPFQLIFWSSTLSFQISQAS